MAVLYKTPEEEMSFSALIDQALRITGRVTALEQAVSYGNAVFRECQGLGLFDDDALEESYVTDAEPYIFTPTRLHRRIWTAHYVERDIYPRFIRPGRKQNDVVDNFYYKANSYFAFRGIREGETLNLFNYYWLPSLRYYRRLEDTSSINADYDIRPAYYNPFTDTWSYYDTTTGTYIDTLGTDALNEAAQGKSLNWLVTKWYDLVLEGVKGKLWTAVNDDRGKTSFSLYKSYQNDLSKESYPSEDN